MAQVQELIFREQTLETVALEAFHHMKDERDDLFPGYDSRWTKFNAAVLKRFRTESFYTLAGASGSGKSYILTNMITDFTDQDALVIKQKGLSNELIDYVIGNGEFLPEGNNLVRLPLNADKKPLLWLHFGYDMAPKVELIRTICPMIGRSYAYLNSSQPVKGVDGKYRYNKLTDEELLLTQKVMNALGRTRPNVRYFRIPQNIEEIVEIVDRYANAYPNHKVGVSVDHSLLLKKSDPTDGDQELLDNQARVLKDVRDTYRALIVLLTQMNSNIEDDRRRTTPQAHFPVKSDMYRGGQIFQSSDYVITIFMPASIGISAYGPKGYPSEKLIHAGIIKSRHGEVGQIWLRNELHRGQIYQGEFDAKKNFTIIPNFGR
jgi:DnaB-like helicase C terminal domain